MDGEAGWRKNKRGEENRTYIYIYKFLLSWLKKYVDKVNEEVA